MKKSLVALLVFSMVIALNVAIARAEENVIFKEVVTKGVPLSNGKTTKLIEPVMADGLDDAAQMEVITRLVAKGQLDSFLKAGISDYYELDKTSISGAKPEDSIGRQIDLYFVARGKVETAADSAFMKKLLNQGEQPGDCERRILDR